MSDAVVIPPGEEKHGDEPQVLSPSPKPAQVPVQGQPLKPSTGELLTHLKTYFDDVRDKTKRLNSYTCLLMLISFTLINLVV